MILASYCGQLRPFLHQQKPLVSIIIFIYCANSPQEIHLAMSTNFKHECIMYNDSPSSPSPVPSPPPQLSLLAVRITRLQVTIAVVEDWVRGDGYFFV